MIHQLKTETQYFQAVVSGVKSFEVRENDRIFVVGDFLALNELKEDEYTGRCCLVEVTYILTDKRFVKEGYVLLGIRPCNIGTVKDNLFVNDPLRPYRVPIYDVVQAMEARDG